ncbi:MAG: diacylglycerol kinase family protein [Candidatus Dojkabacteria bacterium]|jgi:undecaprenol kinase|nr:diacylglycerol kinase family protein [Candidatus Dojkabacteria bacterium]
MENNFKTPQPILKSQRHAIDGILSIVKNERNFRIQLVVAMLVVLISFLLKISHSDWIAVGFLITLVLISEAFNSVIEALCDTISHEYRVNIKYAKDVSAGAVLVSAILSVILGLIIFMPYIIDLLIK